MVPGSDESPPAALPPQKAAKPLVNFLTFLEQIDEGRLASTADEECAVLVRELRRQAQIVGLKPKGKLTITLAFEANTSVVDVSGEVKLTMPRQPRARSSFFPTRENRLAAVDPAQLGMQFRDVSDTAPIIRKV